MDVRLAITRSAAPLAPPKAKADARADAGAAAAAKAPPAAPSPSAAAPVAEAMLGALVLAQRADHDEAEAAIDTAPGDDGDKPRVPVSTVPAPQPPQAPAPAKTPPPAALKTNPAAALRMLQLMQEDLLQARIDLAAGLAQHEAAMRLAGLVEAMHGQTALALLAAGEASLQAAMRPRMSVFA